MAPKENPAEERIIRHKDGSLWAKGKLRNGEFTGYWEWFRKDGTKLRSGWFEDGEQTGEWTTYDKEGKAFKVTQMKPKLKKPG
jgi:antitoxin component YwqK of YwqJK toxin-antitoxin module